MKNEEKIYNEIR